LPIQDHILDSFHVDEWHDTYLKMGHKKDWCDLGPGLWLAVRTRQTTDKDDYTQSEVVSTTPIKVGVGQVRSVLNLEWCDYYFGDYDTTVYYLGPVPTAEPTPTPCKPIIIDPIIVAPPDMSGARVLDHLPGENFTNFAMEFKATGQIQINYRNAKGRYKFFASVQDQWRSAFEEVGTGWIRIDPIIKPEEFKNTDQKTYILQVRGPRTMIRVDGKYSLGKDYMYQADFLQKGNITMEEGQIDFPLKIIKLSDNSFYDPLPRELPLTVDMTSMMDLERYMGHDYEGSIFTDHLGTRVKWTYGAKYLAGLRTLAYNNVYPETQNLWGNRETKFRIRFCGNICVWGERTKDNENGLLVNFLGDAWGAAGFYQMIGKPGEEPKRICLEKFAQLPRDRELNILIEAVDDELGLYVNAEIWKEIGGIDLGTGAISIKNGGNGILETDDALMSGLLTVTGI